MTANMRTQPLNPVDHLDNPEDIASYIQEAFETEDPAYAIHALESVTRAKGITEIIRKAGVSRDSLDKALSAEGNPEFATILKVMSALDLKITARAG